MKVKIRFMRKEDVPGVVDCENRSHAYEDPDFGKLVASFAWNTKEVTAAASQVRNFNRKRQTNDTASYVATITKIEKKDGAVQAVEYVCGAFIFTLLESSIDILLFTAHPEAPENTRTEMLNHLIGVAARSEDRKQISIHVPDGDYKTLKFFQDNGFKYKLKYNPKGNDDWYCECNIENTKKSLASA